MLSHDPADIHERVDAMLVTERAAMRATLAKERAEMQATIARERAEMRAEMQATIDQVQRNAQDLVQRVLNENNALRAELGRVKDAVNTLAARYFDNVHFESTEQITADHLCHIIANFSGVNITECIGTTTYGVFILDV